MTSDHATSPLNFIFMNGKGASGKDTQAELIIEDNPQAVRISTGDAIRAIADNPDHPMHGEIKPQIDAAFKEGKLLSDDVVLKIVDSAIRSEIAGGKNTLIFTGYPRTTRQLEDLDSYITDFRQIANDEGRQVNTRFIHYDITDEISRERAASRREAYIADGKVPRKDDDPTVVKQRLTTYREQTQPMLDLLRERGQLINIDASGSIEEVFELTRKALGLMPTTVEGGRNSQEDKTPTTQEEPLRPLSSYSRR